MNQTTELTPYEAKLKEFRGFVGKQLMPKVAAACPPGVQPNTIIRTLFNAIESNPQIIQKCTPLSLGRALIRAATYGLEISAGQLGHAYIVPYGDDAQLQLSYKGVKELVRRSGQGIVIMNEVREGDQFAERGKLAPPLHVESTDPNRFEQPLTHAYAIMQFHSGLTIVSVWSKEKCIAHRNKYSQNWRRVAGNEKKAKDSPWHEDNPQFTKMCQKTCVHALANDGDLPLSAEVRDLLRDKEHQATDTIDAEAVGTQAIESHAAQAITDQTPAEETLTEADIWQTMQLCETPLAVTTQRDELSKQWPDMKQQIWDAAQLRSDHLEAEATQS